MPYASVEGMRLYYELTGDQIAPALLQVGGPMFGRHNFRNVNGIFARHFQLLSYDASGYGRSTSPQENYSIEAWADEAAGLLDQLQLSRVFVLGTSMGGMIAFALTAKRPDLVRATCADCTFLRPDLARRLLLRSWRHMIEAMPLDEFCDLLTMQSVSPAYLEMHPELVEATRAIVGTNSLFTLRQSCLAREKMDLEPLVPMIRRPILFTNGGRDTLTPSRLATSGYSAMQAVEAIPAYARHHEFQEAQHAGLLECPDIAAELITSFFLSIDNTVAA
jgi:3-oxoadipate enol-lactonase